MGILDSFERGLDRVVNGAFARTFRSGLQPVEITAALRREMDTRAAPVARDRILVPNRYTVRMSAADHIAMTALGDGLNEELSGLLQEHARGQGYQMSGPIVIDLVADDSLVIGMIEVTSASERVEVVWTPVVEVAGERRVLRDRLVIGRGSEADITIDDSGISRKHLEITWDGKRAVARDLGSTNGSKLNGERFTRIVLENGTELTVGRTRVRFQLVAQQSGRA